jgi:membrane-bound metal-dependent hydrolase YbcI (DUF457 family)
MKKHMVVAAGVGGGINLVCQLYKLFNSPNRPQDFWETLRRLDFLEAAAFAAIGGACGALPDFIEPADNPNHRALFHSLACAGVLTYGAFGKHTANLMPGNRHAIRIATLSYLSHLLLDSETPKGLPIVGLPAIGLG